MGITGKNRPIESVRHPNPTPRSLDQDGLFQVMARRQGGGARWGFWGRKNVSHPVRFWLEGTLAQINSQVLLARISGLETMTRSKMPTPTIFIWHVLGCPCCPECENDLSISSRRCSADRISEGYK